MIIASTAIVAGIGFAGSYAAVRELALKKGFGNFAYVFPVGIDAGICVLLALDLLLTFHRIPLALLRQTAWLLTAATIAFNGAAAWPDPLGVGMHGVIPVLFIVAVEAARHAIGRIADITADKHMEGVRLTRWLLSPVPTFLLWRRMKLWELRSYEQVIKLEQQRLVYRARLHSRYGRAWRRKAPVESLIPLRLARYGFPLTTTAPAGVTAAGLEPDLLPSASQPEVTNTPAATDSETSTSSHALGATCDPQESAPSGEQRAQPAGNTPPGHDTALLQPLDGRNRNQERQATHRPDAVHSMRARLSPLQATRVADTCDGSPNTRAHDSGTWQKAMHTDPTCPSPALAPHSTSSAARPHRADTTPSPQASPTGSATHQPRGRTRDGQLTLPDRYYLAWTAYKARHGSEPTGHQLSAYLAAQGMLGRNQQPISPANLRRHFLRWRIYDVWARYRADTQEPSAPTIADECARRGITAQYNQRIAPHHITTLTPDFERRWHALKPIHRH
ncbi:DUF2637 domain-containing protein [Streptomyces gilvifuscus]|uniref:DUF2637 domain-containing protein n=1 Tax=Streptomyces gilvifuscus TaxID=1550617 RepID=A0ABT5G994_9ACTN|nr:DUF2637 domain-containing protein [Streptomyces gilvifuscus]MDC2961293.1 DUF2637 domain-containing protein [Streptomyces gilvifuscus]